MKILFVASIQGKADRLEDYQMVVDSLKQTTNEVISDHVMKYTQEDLDSWSEDQKINFHKKLFDYIKKCDMVVGEVSYPSVSVGYLISMALDLGKPTILLYKGKSEPNLLSSLVSDKLQVLNYNSKAELEKELSSSIDYASQQADVRFNFFISPQIGLYLDWISKNKRVPRAVYLRRLIEEDMRSNSEYNEGTDE